MSSIDEVRGSFGLLLPSAVLPVRKEGLLQPSAALQGLLQPSAALPADSGG